MYCKKCGSLLNDGDKFCKKCGATIENGSDNTSTNVEPLNTEKGSTNKDRNNAIKLMIIVLS